MATFTIDSENNVTGYAWTKPITATRSDLRLKANWPSWQPNGRQRATAAPGAPRLGSEPGRSSGPVHSKSSSRWRSRSCFRSLSTLLAGIEDRTRWHPRSAFPAGAKM
jgi:hypothetical protein